MSGININARGPSGSLAYLFKLQKIFQESVIEEELNLPQDLPKWYAYHMLAMQEELGEVLKTDKRWKTFRNTDYNLEDKVMELSDVFITLLNIVLFSGISADDFEYAVIQKISENFDRLKSERVTYKDDIDY